MKIQRAITKKQTARKKKGTMNKLNSPCDGFRAGWRRGANMVSGYRTSNSKQTAPQKLVVVMSGGAQMGMLCISIDLWILKWSFILPLCLDSIQKKIPGNTCPPRINES